MWVLILLALACTVIQADPKIRNYYISVKEVSWNYAPTGQDNLRGVPLEDSPAAVYTVANETRIGSVYTKAVYRQYRDDTFTQPVTHDPIFGLLGPVIRAEEGDTIHILFKNEASRPYSLHPHGHSGTHPPGEAIQPNHTYNYVWNVPPLQNNETSLWAYVSRTDPVADVNAGLLGPIVIYPAGTLERPTPGSPEMPKDIDQEVFTLMMITDEGLSPYLEESARSAGIALPEVDEAFLESNRMFHINGYVYNNMPMLHLEWGTAVRWYMLSYGLGLDKDVHTAHWHGSTLLHHGHRVDVVDLMPIGFEVLDLMPDNEGQWLFHCHVAHHFEAGMTAFYQVDKTVFNGEEDWGEG